MTAHTIRDITVDPAGLCEMARRFVDPGDRRLLMEIRFAPAPYRGFLLAWIIMGIDDQYDVKCLVPIEDTIHYSARTHGGASTVHGSSLAIYDAIHHLPIDQSLELDTKFSLVVPMVTTDYAKTILSDRIVPLESSKKGAPARIPFNRRNYLLCIEPGESLSMQFRVGYAPNYSIRERTHWYLLGEEGLAIGTQLGRSPVAYLQTIIRQLDRRLEQVENNRLDLMLRKSGLTAPGDREAVLVYLRAASKEILAMDPGN